MDNGLDKLESLDLLQVSSSGLDEIFYNDQKEKRFDKFLAQFLLEANNELDAHLQINPQEQDSMEIKALFLLNLIFTNQRIQPFYIYVSKPQPQILDQIAFTLIDLYKSIYFNAKLKSDEFYNFNFYSLVKFLPSIAIYYSDFILKDKFWHYSGDSEQTDEILEQAEKVIFDDEIFSALVDDNLVAQKHRLRALYHRRKADNEKAEEEILSYRDKFKPNLKKDRVLNKIYPRQSFLAKDLLESLDVIYQEAYDIQKEVLVRSGVFEDTCFYYSCGDCCKKDFPTVSYTEFMFIKNHLEKEAPDKLEDAKKRAEAIQATYNALTSKRLSIVDQATTYNQEENPEDFKFACPFLDEKDMCTVHKIRPLACRTFGLSTIDNETVQACRYYLTQFQFNSSHRNDRDVYDSRQHTALIGAANIYMAKKGELKKFKQPVAVLPAWLTEL